MGPQKLRFWLPEASGTGNLDIDVVVVEGPEAQPQPKLVESESV